MRYKEHEINDPEVIQEIMQKAEVCHLACSLKDRPYVVPISFGIDGDEIYFHSSRAGKKASILRENPQVCLGFEIGIEAIPDPGVPCDWNFQYMSVIADGKAEKITSPDEKGKALNIIMKHYSGREWDFPADELARTDIWKVKVESISGKRSPEDLNLSDLK